MGMTQPPETLDALRREIDAIDRELLQLLSARARVAQQVGEVKAAVQAPVWRPEREANVIAALQQENLRANGPLPAGAISAIWTEIMSACRALERRMRVGFLGPVGTFSELALRRQFGESVDAVPCASIDEVFRATQAGSVDFGVVPVENSTEGAVSRTLDLYLQSPLLICGEVAIAVRQNLMTRTGTMDGVTRIVGHAQSLAQCFAWLNAHYPDLPRVAVASNAEGARLAAADSSVAAIAGERAAQTYGLALVATAIQDDPSNRTRFQVIGHHACGRSGDDQTSLILSVADRAGAVHALIEPFARHGVSMKRFESRPARTNGWEYIFHVDLVGHQDDPALAAALAELRECATLCRILGSYPRAR
jgi:chorismate mutase/prephenate dehydratase